MGGKEEMRSRRRLELKERRRKKKEGKGSMEEKNEHKND